MSKNSNVMELKTNDTDIVLIIGICPRSGTNYLSKIVCCIDGFEAVDIAKEDHLFEKAFLLKKFAYDSARRWLPWNDKSTYNSSKTGEDLLGAIGSGIVSFFKDTLTKKGSKPVLKTPITFFTRNRLLDSNFSSLYQLFPNAKVILLIRDSTDTIISAHKTWPKKPFLLFVIRWIFGAKHIINLNQEYAYAQKSRPLLIKYEEMIHDTYLAAEKIRVHLGGTSSVDFKARVKGLPIVGSSKIKDKNGNVTWDPLEKKDAQFNAVIEKKDVLERTIIKMLTNRYRKIFGF
jgi:hypothetical protein